MDKVQKPSNSEIYDAIVTDVQIFESVFTLK
jgi:hypothetical protein